MTLYELNQAGYNSLPAMTEQELNKAKEEILQYLTTFDGDYYVLLSNEKRYYTLFTYTEKHKYYNMANEILSIASELGELKAIERNGDIIEFWVSSGDNCNMYALLSYDQGVIKV